MTQTRPALPADFEFGVATASYQIEGAVHAGLAKSTFYWARGHLLKSGRLVSVGTRSRQRLELP